MGPFILNITRYQHLLKEFVLNNSIILLLPNFISAVDYSTFDVNYE